MTDIDPTVLYVVSDEDVRSTMAALNFGPAQEFNPSDFLDDEDPDTP